MLQQGPRIALFVCVALAGFGCGGAHINGRLLTPPAPSIDEVRVLARAAPVDNAETPRIRPVNCRVYSSGELIVDVMLVMPSPQQSQTWVVQNARFFTNGLNVPARLHSDGRPKSTIEVKD